jgi:hypothetical protein
MIEAFAPNVDTNMFLIIQYYASDIFTNPIRVRLSL